jgi:hypothetical protein
VITSLIGERGNIEPPQTYFSHINYVEQMIKYHPHYCYHLPDYNESEKAVSEFEKVLLHAGYSDLFVYLEEDIHYLRMAVHSILEQNLKSDFTIINKAYKTGSPRLRFELIDYIKPVRTDKEKYQILDEIIHDDCSVVYWSDFFDESGNPGIKAQKYPFDIIGYCARLIENEHTQYRRDAAEILSNLNPDYYDVLPTLLDALQNEDSSIHRLSSIYTLGELGKSSADAITGLEVFMDDLDIDIRLASLVSLVKIDPDNELYKKALQDEIEREKESHQHLRSLLYALGHLGEQGLEFLPSIMKLNYHRDIAVHEYVFFIGLSFMNSDEQRIEFLLENIEHENPYIRIVSILHLSRFHNNPDVRKALFESLNDDNLNVKLETALVLLEYYPGDSRITLALMDIAVINPGMIELMESPTQFKAFNRHGLMMFSDLFKITPSSSNKKNEEILHLTDALGVENKVIIDKLIQMLSLNDVLYKRHAISFLGELGEISVDALPVIVALDDDDGDRTTSLEISKSVTMILQSINSDTPVSYEVILEVMPFDSDRDLQNATKAALACGATYEEIARKMCELLYSEDDRNVRNAFYGLKELGGNAVSVLPDIFSFYEKQTDKSLRQQGKRCIFSILESLDSQALIPEDIIIGFLEANDAMLMNRAFKSISRNEGRFEKTIDLLVEKAQSKDFVLAQKALEGLRILGDKSVTAFPALIELLGRSDIPEKWVSYKNKDGGTVVKAGTLSKQGIMSTICGILWDIDSNSNVSESDILILFDFPDGGLSKDQEERIAINAVNALIKIQKDNDSKISKLIELGKHENKHVASKAISELWIMSENATEYITEISKLPASFPTDKENTFLIGSDFALMKILNEVNADTDVNINEIIKLIEKENCFVMRRAVEAAYSKAGNYDLVVDKLAELLFNESIQMRKNALSQIADLKADSIKILPELKKFADEAYKLEKDEYDLKPRVNYVFSEVLKAADQDSDISIELLFELMEIPDFRVVRQSVRLLKIKLYDYEPIIIKLVELLSREEKANPKRTIIILLGEFKHEASDALPVLKAIEKAGSDYFKKAVKEAIAKIENNQSESK